MSLEDQILRERFQNQFENWEVEPQKDLWGELQNQIPKKPAHVIHIKKILIQVSSAAAAVTLGVVGYFYMNNSTPQFSEPVAAIENPVEPSLINKEVQYLELNSTTYSKSKMNHQLKKASKINKKLSNAGFSETLGGSHLVNQSGFSNKEANPSQKLALYFLDEGAMDHPDKFSGMNSLPKVGVSQIHTTEFNNLPGYLSDSDYEDEFVKKSSNFAWYWNWGVGRSFAMDDLMRHKIMGTGVVLNNKFSVGLLANVGSKLDLDFLDDEVDFRNAYQFGVETAYLHFSDKLFSFGPYATGTLNNLFLSASDGLASEGTTVQFLATEVGLRTYVNPSSHFRVGIEAGYTFTNYQGQNREDYMYLKRLENPNHFNGWNLGVCFQFQMDLKNEKDRNIDFS